MWIFHPLTKYGNQLISLGESGARLGIPDHTQPIRVQINENILNREKNAPKGL